MSWPSTWARHELAVRPSREFTNMSHRGHDTQLSWVPFTPSGCFAPTSLGPGALQWGRSHVRGACVADVEPRSEDPPALSIDSQN